MIRTKIEPSEILVLRGKAKVSTVGKPGPNLCDCATAHTKDGFLYIYIFLSGISIRDSVNTHYSQVHSKEKLGPLHLEE